MYNGAAPKLDTSKPVTVVKTRRVEPDLSMPTPKIEESKPGTTANGTTVTIANIDDDEYRLPTPSEMANFAFGAVVLGTAYILIAKTADYFTGGAFTNYTAYLSNPAHW